MIRRPILVVAGALLFPLIFTNCGSRELKVTAQPTYTWINSNIVQAKCTSCHESLATYSGLMAIVSAGKPDESKFYEEIEEGGMPEHSVKLSDDEINAVKDWITAGALK